MTKEIPAPVGSAPASEPATILAELRAVFESGRTLSADWRIAQFRGIERLLARHEDEVVAALDADLRRHPSEAYLGDISVTAAEAAYARKHLKSWMKPKNTSIPLMHFPGKGQVRSEPLGVALIIGTWNYPIYLTLSPLMAAISGGNCAVLKTSELAPASSSLIAGLLPKYVDPEAIRVVEGGADTTQELLRLGFDHALFTGGTEVGKLVMATAAETLTPVTLELGGKNPVVVTSDADITIAARRTAWLKVVNSGQTCIAPDYAIVAEEVRDEFVARVTACLDEFGGNRRETWSPIVNERHFERVKGLIASSSGRIEYGGQSDDGERRIQPAVILDPADGDAVMREEIFGPVLPVLSYSSVTDAARKIKKLPAPLALYVFGSTESAEQIIDRVPSGAAVINHVAVHCTMPQLPFGGVGASGIGHYHGRWGFDTFSHQRSVVTMSTKGDPKFMYPPYKDWIWRILRKVL